MTLIGHRGSCYEMPENTLVSVMKGWEEGAEFVEIDVHLSRDNRIMVMHDPTTGRTAGVNLKISDTDSSELRKLDVGRWKGDQFAGQKMPFLEEVLETIPDDRTLLIEVKCGPEILPLLKKTIDRSRKSARVSIISFSLNVVAGSKKLMPSIPALLLLGATKDPNTGAVTEHSTTHIETAKQHGLDGLDIHHSGITKTFVTAVHDAGLLLYAWTVNDPAEVKRLFDVGTGVVATDRPGWMREQLG